RRGLHRALHQPGVARFEGEDRPRGDRGGSLKPTVVRDRTEAPASPVALGPQATATKRRREAHPEAPLGRDRRPESLPSSVGLGVRPGREPEPPDQPESAVSGRQPERLESEPALRAEPRADPNTVDDRSLLTGEATSHFPQPHHATRSLVREPRRRGRRRSATLLDTDGGAGEALSEKVDDLRRSNGDPSERSFERSLDQDGGRGRGRGDEPRELAVPLPPS